MPALTHTARFDHLWNDMPFAERERLHPYQVESQILHLKQARAVLVRSHNRTLAEIDGWVENLEREIRR